MGSDCDEDIIYGEDKEFSVSITSADEITALCFTENNEKGECLSAVYFTNPTRQQLKDLMKAIREELTRFKK